MSARLALQKAVRAVLAATPAVTARVGARIYDRPPQDVAFPWVQLGDAQEIDDGVDCMEHAVEVFFDLHVWSRAVGRTEAGEIAWAIKSALHVTAPVLDDPWACVEIEVRDVRHLTDPDGKTSHAVLTLRAMIDPAA